MRGFLFIYFSKVEVNITCCSLEVFHEPGLFAFLPSLALLLGFFVFIFYSAEVNQLPGFYQHFICCSVELSDVPGFFFFYFWRVEV